MVTPARERDIDQAVARGSELLKQGNLDSAQKVFRAALALEAGNPRVLALLGLTYFKAGQFSDARPIYEELVERAPTDASHRLNLGLVYLKLGSSERAISALEASRALDPSQGRAVSYLGLAYARAGRYAEAYRAFLLAGQHELAKEIEINLTPAELDGIHAQLARSGLEPTLPRERRTTKPSEPPENRTSDLGPRTSAREEPRATPPRPPPKAEPPKPEPPKAEPPKPEPRSEVEIKIIAEPEPEPERPREQVSEAAIIVSEPPPPQEPSDEIEAPRMTDSQMFVLPQPAPAPEPVPDATDKRSMISRAVAAASATSARATAGESVAAPIPLSQLATEELVRADDSEQPFEVTASGALIIRLGAASGDRVLTRLDGVHVTGGDLAYEPATRRSRGHQTEDKFDYGGTQLHVVTGKGYLIALPGDRTFTAVALDDDIFYLREDLVFAFEASLRWENGNVPGLRGRLPVVQFRGDGIVALHTAKPLVRVKLPAQGVVFVDARRLAGWIGRVIPRAVVPPADGPMGEVCVECTGEGIVLVDPIGDPGSLAAPRAKKESLPPPSKERAKPPTPPPAANPLGELLTDDEF